MQEGRKICKTCFREKLLIDYYFRKETNSHKNTCKRCVIDGKRMKDQDNKLCKHCGLIKPKSDFQKVGGGKWLQPYCKTCDSIRKKKHWNENMEAYKQKANKYYAENKAIISAKGKEERRIAAIGRPKRVFKRMPIEEKKRRKRLQDKRYREQNPDVIKRNKREYKESGRALEAAKAWQKKKKNDVSFVTKKRLRGRIYVALKRGVKSQSTMSLLGCSIDFFKEYFQSLFTDGMTWERYMEGAIVIDHIKPCVKFDLTDPEEQKKCFHYTNLQPLWELDNLKKGVTYNENIQKCQKTQ